jgi:quinol monooxygenase YgiN
MPARALRIFRDARDGACAPPQGEIMRSIDRRRFGLLAGVCLLATTPTFAKPTMEDTMTTLAKHHAPTQGSFALSVTWEAKPGEGDAVAEILHQMAEAVRSEPGTLLFWPHRSKDNDHVFLLYELYVDEAAFTAHQQTPHFKSLIVGQALAKLARRERVPFVPFGPA